MTIGKKVFESSQEWIYRNARPVDLARWQYHFENGTAENVLKTLSYYQNEDGGFGHALEADSWNPQSSPIQTWAAMEILREIGFADDQHDMIKGILRYLENGKDFACEVWQNSIPSNNDYPHAFWWDWSENATHYNPTAYLCGFIIKYTDKGSALHDKGISIAKKAVSHFMNSSEINEIGDGHLNLCYLRLRQFCEELNESNIFDMRLLNDKLSNNIKPFMNNLQLDNFCDGVILEIIKAYRDELCLITDNKNVVETICTHLYESQRDDGTWDIPWNWNEYPDQWSISKNWWKAYGIIVNLLFLKQFGHLLR